MADRGGVGRPDGTAGPGPHVAKHLVARGREGHPAMAALPARIPHTSHICVGWISNPKVAACTMGRYGARSVMGFMGANCGSQRVQIHPGPPRRLRSVTAGKTLPVRFHPTGPDTGFAPGGQGVAGSNPAVPTGFSNTCTLNWERNYHDRSHVNASTGHTTKPDPAT
jgi:hypothetical protein